MLHLDFRELNNGCDTVEQFESRLMTVLAGFCQSNGLTVMDDRPTFRTQLRTLLNQVLSRALVLLFDEVDTPLIYLAADGQDLKAGTLFLCGLFALVKSHSGQCRSVFFTSSMLLRKLALDTADNSLIDVSDDMGIATCCGFTRV